MAGIGDDELRRPGELTVRLYSVPQCEYIGIGYMYSMRRWDIESAEAIR